MKRIIFFLFLVFTPFVLLAQFPANPRVFRLGYQTTADGLIYRGSGAPAYTPSAENDTRAYIDTDTGDFYIYNGGWRLMATGSGTADYYVKWITSDSLGDGYLRDVSGVLDGIRLESDVFLLNGGSIRNSSLDSGSEGIHFEGASKRVVINDSTVGALGNIGTLNLNGTSGGTQPNMTVYSQGSGLTWLKFGSYGNAVDIASDPFGPYGLDMFFGESSGLQVAHNYNQEIGFYTQGGVFRLKGDGLLQGTEYDSGLAFSGTYRGLLASDNSGNFVLADPSTFGSTEVADGTTILGDGTGGNPFRVDTTLMVTTAALNDSIAGLDGNWLKPQLESTGSFTITSDSQYVWTNVAATRKTTYTAPAVTVSDGAGTTYTALEYNRLHAQAAAGEYTTVANSGMTTENAAGSVALYEPEQVDIQAISGNRGRLYTNLAGEAGLQLVHATNGSIFIQPDFYDGPDQAYLTTGNYEFNSDQDTTGLDGYVQTFNSATGQIELQAGTAGDVVGPGSSTDNAIARYDGTTGKLLQNSSVTITDGGNIALGSGYLSGDGGSEGIFIASNSFVGVNTATPTYQVHVVTESNGAGRLMNLSNHSSISSSSAPGMVYTRSRGTAASPTGVKSGDFILYQLINAHNGTAYEGDRRVMQVNATENWTTGAGGFGWGLYSRPNGSVGTPTEVIRLEENGFVGIGETNPVHKLDATGDISATGKLITDSGDISLDGSDLVRIETGSGSPESVVSASPGSTYHDTTNGIIYVKESGTGSTGWAAFSTGTPANIYNTNGTQDDAIRTWNLNSQDLYVTNGATIYIGADNAAFEDYMSIDSSGINFNNNDAVNGTNSFLKTETAFSGGNPALQYYGNTATKGVEIWAELDATNTQEGVRMSVEESATASADKNLFWGDHYSNEGLWITEGDKGANISTHTTYFTVDIGNNDILVGKSDTDVVIQGTIWLDSGKTIGIFHGTGSPESAVTAAVGSTFHRTDGGASTTLYVKESGAGNTGWIAK